MGVIQNSREAEEEEDSRESEGKQREGKCVCLERKTQD